MGHLGWNHVSVGTATDGVQDATVSLNDGYAKVDLAPDNDVTLERIRKVIRENGFTPKDAKLIVAGRLPGTDDRPVLALTNQRFSLVVSPDAQVAWQQLQRQAPDASVEIEGRVDESDATRIVLLAVKVTE